MAKLAVAMAPSVIVWPLENWPVMEPSSEIENPRSTPMARPSLRNASADDGPPNCTRGDEPPKSMSNVMGFAPAGV